MAKEESNQDAISKLNNDPNWIAVGGPVPEDSPTIGARVVELEAAGHAVTVAKRADGLAQIFRAANTAAETQPEPEGEGNGLRQETERTVEEGVQVPQGRESGQGSQGSEEVGER